MHFKSTTSYQKEELKTIDDFSSNIKPFIDVLLSLSTSPSVQLKPFYGTSNYRLEVEDFDIHHTPPFPREGANKTLELGGLTIRCSLGEYKINVFFDKEEKFRSWTLTKDAFSSNSQNKEDVPNALIAIEKTMNRLYNIHLEQQKLKDDFRFVELY